MPSCSVCKNDARVRSLQVLSAAVPDIQRRHSELQPVALATLCSLLQLLASGLHATAADDNGTDSTLAMAVHTLRALRAALADANHLPEQQGISSSALVALLFQFVGALRQAPPDRDDEASEQLAQVAGAALDCAADLQAKHFGAQATQQMLEVLLPKLQVSAMCCWGCVLEQPLPGLSSRRCRAKSVPVATRSSVKHARSCQRPAQSSFSNPDPSTHHTLACLVVKETCGLVQERWARRGGALQLDDPLLPSFVRLLVQFFTMQLRCMVGWGALPLGLGCAMVAWAVCMAA